MVVAILTARRAELTGASDLFGFIEWLYLALLGWLAVRGAGALSLDRLLARRISSSAETSIPTASGNPRAA